MAKKTIGLVFSSMDSESTIEFYRGIRDEAMKHNYSTQGFVIYPSTLSSKEYNDGEFYIFETIDFTKYDALVVALNTFVDSHVREKLRKQVENAGIPVIAIDCEIEGAYNFYNNNYPAVRQQFDILVREKNCKKINYLSGPNTNEESQERLQAYLDGMQENGFSTEGRVFEGSFYVQDGELAVQYFENEPNAKDFDAIMCGNDMMAISVYAALMERGIRVPEDVIVTGYDAIKEVQNTPIQTIGRDNYSNGKKCIEVLNDIWAGNKVKDAYYLNATLTDNRLVFASNEIRNVNQEFKLFVSDKNIHALTRSFIEEGTMCKDFSEYIQVIKKFIRKLNPENFQFVIRGEYAEAFKLGDKASIDFVTPDGEKAQMINVLIYENGNFIEEDFIQMSERMEAMQKELNLTPEEMWMKMIEIMPMRQSLNTPLHFHDKKFGFVSFSKTEFPLMERSYWDWIMALNFTINNVYNLAMSDKEE